MPGWNSPGFRRLPSRLANGGEGETRTPTQQLVGCSILTGDLDYHHPLIGIEAKTRAPDYRSALVHALKAVAAAGDALVALAEALGPPEGTQGWPEPQQVSTLPAVHTNGKQGVHHG